MSRPHLQFDGSALQRVRESKGLTQRDLADRVRDKLDGKKQQALGSVGGTLQAQATQGASGSSMALIQAQAVQANSGSQRNYFRCISSVMTKLIKRLGVRLHIP